MWTSIVGFLGKSVVGKVFGFLNKRGKRGLSLDIAGIQSTENTWKDEFITAIILFPLILINFAMLLSILSITWMWIKGEVTNGYSLMIDNIIYGIEGISRFPDFYQHLMYITIACGLGLYVLAKNAKRKNGNGNAQIKKGDTSADVFRAPK